LTRFCLSQMAPLIAIAEKFAEKLGKEMRQK
jgi:hypothetical protein